MGKHTYKATAFQRLNWDELRERTVGQKTVFAIDVAKHGFVAMLMTQEREALATLKWTHPGETQALLSCIESLPGQLEAVMEPTGSYGDSLRYWLGVAGIPVYRIAGKRVSDAKELYDGVASIHDGKSAYIIARQHLEHIPTLWPAPSEQRRRLHVHAHRLRQHHKHLRQELNRLEGLLAAGWPEYDTLIKVETISSLRLLAHYGSPHAVRDDRDGAATLLNKVSQGKLAKEKITQLLDSATHTQGVPMIADEVEFLQELAQTIIELKDKIRRREAQMAAGLEDDASLLSQASVVGRVTTAVLYSALGSPENYPNAGSYAKAAGLHLKEHSSGKFKGQLKITKRGPSEARFYLYFAALRLIRSSTVTRRWYDAKVARDGGKRLSAITAVMRKLIKALWHVGQGEVFDDRLLFKP